MDVVHHSDHGTQETSLSFGQRCKAAGVRPSMGSVGDACDNALCESFFASDRDTFPNHAQAGMALFRWIEGWYTPRRRHAALGYDSPAEFERKHAAA